MAARSKASGRGAPLPPATVQLLRRADAELLAALRAATALVAAWGRPTTRRGPRAVWELLARTAPEFEGWTAYFASGARARADIEAGVAGVVDEQRSGELLAAAEDFVDEVRIALEESAQHEVAPAPPVVGSGAGSRAG